MKTAQGFEQVMSTVSSWHWNREDFAEQWNCILKEENGSDASAGTFYKTRFKGVRLLTVPSADGGYRVAFKTYQDKRFLRYLFRPSLAAREAMGFDAAASLGIPVVDYLALGEERCCLKLVSSYFVTRYEENAETFLYFKEHPEQRADLMKLLKENIVRLAKMHVAGFIHGGAHPRNFLWHRNGDGTIRTVWIDLASVRRMTPSNRKWWKYILTDLTDFSEVFRLTQSELDELMAEYRKVNDLPVAYKLRTDHHRKFSEAYRI
jgi:tRNA A-37 threonylcarbamoyl transferase component Bud32